LGCWLCCRWGRRRRSDTRRRSWSSWVASCGCWLFVSCHQECPFVVVVGGGGGFRIYHSTAVHIQASFWVEETNSWGRGAGGGEGD
jgi:hypothetical protein